MGWEEALRVHTAEKVNSSQRQAYLIVTRHDPRLLRRLLLNIMLGATLQRLSMVVGALGLLGHLAIADNPADSALHSALRAVANALAQVAQLALGLLCLALFILALAILAQRLVAHQPAERLLAGAERLVPRALLAARVVRRHARAGDRDAAEGAAGLREVALGVGFGAALVGFALRGLAWGTDGRVGGQAYLVGGVAREGAEGALRGARGGVDVALEGGGVLVRHGGCVCVCGGNVMRVWVGVGEEEEEKREREREKAGFKSLSRECRVVSPPPLASLHVTSNDVTRHHPRTIQRARDDDPDVQHAASPASLIGHLSPCHTTEYYASLPPPATAYPGPPRLLLLARRPRPRRPAAP